MRPPRGRAPFRTVVQRGPGGAALPPVRSSSALLVVLSTYKRRGRARQRATFSVGIAGLRHAQELLPVHAAALLPPIGHVGAAALSACLQWALALAHRPHHSVELKVERLSAERRLRVPRASSDVRAALVRPLDAIA